MIHQSSFSLSKLFRCILCSLATARKWFDTSGKSLAEWHHRENRKARTEKSVAGFFFEIPESDGDRPARCHIFQRPSPGRRGRAVVRALNPYIIGRRART